MRRLTPVLRRLGLKKPWAGFAREQDILPDRLAERLAAPLPDREFLILFTPRSGSSMLGDLARRTGALGKPIELFNPNHMGDMARSFDATNLQTYVDVARRSQKRGGTFGFKIAYPQLDAVFSSPAAFIAMFPDPHVVWLIRRDIVLQGVSLYKMQATQVAHSPSSTPQERADRETAVTYDAGAIKHWITHIRKAEENTEALIAQAGFTPLRMSYEHNITLKPNQLANVLVRHVGLRTLRLPGVSSAHVKIGTDLNSDLAERFGTEHADWVAQMDEDRGPMLEKIDYYGPNRDKTAKRSKPPEARRKRK
jgi:LPS sulfotransferase NodH